MFLVADIGNSNIVIAVHDGDTWKYKYRYETKDIQPSIFYESELRDLFLEWDIQPRQIKDAAISSVVPDITATIQAAIIANIGFDPLLLSPEIFMKLDMEIPKIYEIGSDIVANAYAAKKQFKKNTIIVDFENLPIKVDNQKLARRIFLDWHFLAKLVLWLNLHNLWNH